MHSKVTSHSLALLKIAVLSLMAVGVGVSGQPAQTIPQIAPDNPRDVADTTQVPGNPIRLFDEFSWRMFLTMVWPADILKRGAPDASRQLGTAGPLVFETFRSNWEVFQPGGTAPPLFDIDAAVTPCGPTILPPKPFLIASFSKFGELLQADVGRLAGPLVSQNRAYVRFSTGYDRPSFDHIRDRQLHLKSNHGTTSAPATFPDTSTVVKSAWIEMKDVANPARYYTRQAWIIDPTTGQCRNELMGLVGLHIVKKTKTRPQWIWSSFEHIDNVPDADPSAALAFNNRDGTAMPVENPFATVASPAPEPFNVERVKPIHPATADANLRYRTALKLQGSVWQNYQLVMTQWPLSIADPSKNGRPNNTFPGRNSDQTASANTTMETFEQLSISKGCMACHNETKTETDFVWSVGTHAFSPAEVQFLASNRRKNSDPIMRLKALLKSAVQDNKKRARSNR